MDKKLIFGFTGQIASGKGTAVKYLQEKYGGKNLRFSDSLRDAMNRLYIEINRDNIQRLSLILRQEFGQDLFSKIIAGDVKKSDQNLILIDGVRRPMDIKYLRDISGFVLVALPVDTKIRYERVVARNENIGDGEKTWEQFLEEEKADTEVTIPAAMAEADEVVENNTTLDDFYKKLDDLINKYKK